MVANTNLQLLHKSRNNLCASTELLTVHTWIAGSLLGPSLGRVLLCVSTILVAVPAFTPIHPIFFWISSYTFSSSRLS